MWIIYLLHYHWFQILHIIINIVAQAFYYQLIAIERSENAATCAHQPEYALLCLLEKNPYTLNVQQWS